MAGHSLAIKKGTEWGLRAVGVDKETAGVVGFAIGLVSGVALADAVGLGVQIKIHAAEHIKTKGLEAMADATIEVSS